MNDPNPLPNDSNEPMTPRRKKRLRWFAFLLSLFWPGVGHIYATRIRRGSIIYAVLLIGLTAMAAFNSTVSPDSPEAVAVGIALALGSILFAIWAAIDGARVAGGGAPALTRFNHLWVYLVLIAVVIGVSVADRQLVGSWRAYSLPSQSMMPTLLDGDNVVVSSHYYDNRPAGRGEIVVFKKPTNPKVEYVKRVIGLPGDHIQLVHGELRLNGVPVARRQIEDYVARDSSGNTMRASQWEEVLPDGLSYRIIRVPGTDGSPANNTAEYAVPPGHYFVLGDNRDNSVDSRFMSDVGYVPAANLEGRIEVIHFSAEHASIWEVWKWVRTARWDRFLTHVQ